MILLFLFCFILDSNLLVPCAIWNCSKGVVLQDLKCIQTTWSNQDSNVGATVSFLQPAFPHDYLLTEAFCQKLSEAFCQKMSESFCQKAVFCQRLSNGRALLFAIFNGLITPNLFTYMWMTLGFFPHMPGWHSLSAHFPDRADWSGHSPN